MSKPLKGFFKSHKQAVVEQRAGINIFKLTSSKPPIKLCIGAIVQEDGRGLTEALNCPWEPGGLLFKQVQHRSRGLRITDTPVCVHAYHTHTAQSPSSRTAASLYGTTLTRLRGKDIYTLRFSGVL